MPSIATVSAAQLYGGNTPGLKYGAWNNMYSARSSASTGNIPGGNAATSAGPASEAMAQGGDVSGTSIGAGFVGIAALLALAWFVAHKTGNASEFSNIKASALNILLITLTAIVGIFTLKFIVSKFPIPGITPVILAA
jgi:hypothetical protein